MHVIRSLSLAMALGFGVMALAAGGKQTAAGEVLYNGIRLPAVWPPKVAPNYEPMPVPYLAEPPAVIPIDVGRQLFVDDFLVQTTSLVRVFHKAQYISENPVLKPDRPWEHGCAMVFSDGVWFDPTLNRFRMWYMTAPGVLYAESQDGIRWTKPELDLVKGQNFVIQGRRDSSTTWMDLDDPDPARRFKTFRTDLSPDEKDWRVAIHFSADGVHWGKPVAYSPPCGDRTTVFYNPFRKVWVYGVRGGVVIGRMRYYIEGRDVLDAAQWDADLIRRTNQFWCGADKLDPPRPEQKAQIQLYNLDAVAYESVMLGLFTIWRYDYNEVSRATSDPNRPKVNDLVLGYSRDGFHWSRPDREPFIGVSENTNAWNYGNVQSAGGGCLVVGDKLYFYVSGRQKAKGAATGLATLRRDGFVSMAAPASGGNLTTRPVRFSGKRLFVNVDCPEGELKVEVLDEKGAVMPPFSAENCIPVRADSTRKPVSWKGADDLSALAGKAIRFRFILRNGKLYSFWVSPDQTGASRGYVAAGGPGFTGPTDTVGMAGK